MKKIATLAVIVFALAATSLNAQIVTGGGGDPSPQRPRTHGWPPGPPGSWSNPIRVHVQGVGYSGTMGNFLLGFTSLWFWVTGWDNNATNHGGDENIYYDYQTPHFGQWLTKIATAEDVSAQVIYMAVDSNPPHAKVYYRLIVGPIADQDPINDE